MRLTLAFWDWLPPSHPDGADLLVDVDYTPGTLGRTSGRPEDCYPDEPADLDVIEARLASGGGAVEWSPSREQVRELLALAGDAFEDEAADLDMQADMDEFARNDGW